MNNKKVIDFKDGDSIDQPLMVFSALKCVTNQGLTYLNLDLRDSSGAINAKKWEVTASDEELFKKGNVVMIEGSVIMYRNALQLKVLSAVKLNDNEYNINDFVKASPVDYEKLMEDFTYYRNQIIDDDLNNIVDYILKKRGDKYFTHPGGISIHHDYQSGLLHHTVSMLHHAEYLMDFYGDFDKELVYSAIILHDVDKTVEIEGSVAYQRSVEGNLIGHLPMGYAEVNEAATILNISGEKVTLLEHMILAHHGKPEYGSPVLPMTKEAMLVNFVDNIDCYMNIAIKATQNLEEGTFSDKIFALEGRQLYKPKK